MTTRKRSTSGGVADSVDTSVRQIEPFLRDLRECIGRAHSALLHQMTTPPDPERRRAELGRAAASIRSSRVAGTHAPEAQQQSDDGAALLQCLRAG